MEVTLEHVHAKDDNPHAMTVEERTHDLSQFTSDIEPKWNSEEMAELLPKLADWCGMYASDVKKLSLKDRCKLAEKLIEGDRDGLFWAAGHVNLPPQRAESMWEAYHDDVARD